VTTEFSGPTSRDRILGTKFKPAKSTKSKTQQAIEFLKVSDPTRAQKLITSVLENGRRVLKTSGAKAALDFVNSGLGKDWKLDSEDTETMTIDQGDKKVLINKATGEVVQEFPVTQKAKQLTPQQQAFSNLTPSEQKATFFKSGAEVELDKEGNFSLKLGGATKPQSEKERSAQEKRDLSARDAKINTDSVLEVLDSAIEGIGLTTTGFGSILKVVPGTAAGDLEGDLDTITANLAFKALADMRKASPTGGALGAISERELTLLGATIRSIKQKQSPEKLRENLNSIKTLFENAKQRIDVADSFRRQGIDPNNLTEEQLNTQQETGIKIVIPNHPQHGDVTEEDIEKTMQETGFTRDQVFKALGAQ
jgi:NACalpha-BTF3-like transcription factor